MSCWAGCPIHVTPRGVRHSLAGVLAAAIGAVAAGARSFVAMGEWARDVATEVLAPLGLDRRAPDEATFRRVLARIDADLLNRILGADVLSYHHDRRQACHRDRWQERAWCR